MASHKILIINFQFLTRQMSNISLHLASADHCLHCVLNGSGGLHFFKDFFFFFFFFYHLNFGINFQFSCTEMRQTIVVFFY